MCAFDSVILFKVKNTEWVLPEPETVLLQPKASENTPECYEGMTDSLLAVNCIFLVVSLFKLFLPNFNSNTGILDRKDFLEGLY